MMIDLNKTLLVATVQHTGSMWLLERLGWNKQTGRGRPLAMVTEPWKLREGGILFAHTTDFEMPLIAAHVGRLPILTTKRSWDAVSASWMKRGKALGELAQQRLHYERLIQDFGATVIDVEKPNL